MNRIVRWILRQHRREIEEWLFNRALYLSEEDFDRLFGHNATMRLAAVRLYQHLREQLRQALEEWLR
jgi:propanediol utilization protein